ncbi:prealbumin-like fold domain-containing protein, partial [Lentilactobacillus kefiri]
MNNVFEDEEGSRDITDLIKGADTPQFFKSIKFTYTDKDGETKSKDVPPVLDDILELPEVLQIHKNIEIEYEWDIDTIKEKAGLDIENGDYYKFDLKGLTYDYGSDGDFDEYIKYNGKTIGRFIMKPTADKYIQNVKIIFLPGDLEGVTNITYKASLKTAINAGAEEISFGESTTGKGEIGVKEELVSIEKDGGFYTKEATGSEQSEDVTNFDMLEWTSNFKVKKGQEATHVELREQFGGSYETNKDKVDYEFTIETSDGKKTIIDDKNSSEYKEIIASSPIFKFNVESLKLSANIVGIKMKMVTPVTNQNERTFKNDIRASTVKLASKEETQTVYVHAQFSRKDDELTKTSKVDKNGKIKYTVQFTVKEEQNSITLKDTLNTDKFEFSTEKQDYTLEPTTDNWLSEGPSVSGRTMTIKFKDDLNPGRYKLTYIVKPVDGVTDKDYSNVSNTVEVNGQKKNNKFGPAFNSKNLVSMDWQKMMTSWSIHVNQTDRDVNGQFVITEPVKGDNPNYLDFKAFYKSFTEDDELTDQVKKHIAFLKKGETDPKWEYKVDKGKTYWNGDPNDQREAFTVSYDETNDQIKITMLSLPKDENKFAIYLYDVPMDKEKVLAAEQGELGSICNYADVKYTGSKDKNTVPSCQKQFENIKSNISKTGKLSKNFLKDKVIDWTTTFNYRQYLGSDERKVLVTDGIDITDEVGEDDIKDADGKTTARHLQDIKEHLVNSLQVSLGKISKNGEKGEDFQKLDPDQFKIDVNVHKNQKVTFNLKLSDAAYEELYQKAGKKVIELKYQSKVTDFKADDEKTYEHLKSWTFNNEVTAQWNKDDKGKYHNELSATAKVSYTDNGYLLSKTGVQEENGIELHEKDEQVKKVGAVKWSLAINGNGYELQSPVKLTDTLSGGHYHLKTTDNQYRLKIYEAKRSLSNGKVIYTKDTSSPLSEGDDYTVEYSDSLNTMVVKFNRAYAVKTPLLVEYYTVTSKTIGTSYSNEVKLTIASKNFEDTEEVESSATVAGQYTTFAANIKKVDSATGSPLQGVKFQVQMLLKDGTWKSVGEEKATDQDGFVSFDGLYDKPTYRIVETSGLQNYDDRWVSKNFTIADAQEESHDGNENTYCMTAENHRTNALKIKKTVTNSLSVNKNDKFEFKVFVTDKEGNVDTDFNDQFKYTVNGEKEDVVIFENGESTNLPEISDGQVITITGLPQDKYYRVVESVNGSYRATHTLDNLTIVDADGNDGNKTDTFQMQQGKDAATGIVKFTNDAKTTHFGFSKKIEGPNASADKDKQFEFMMKVMDENGDVNDDFTGEIEGIKHTTNGDVNVKFDFQNGVAKEMTYSDGSQSPIELKTGESYRNIKLPANVKVKVYEKQDTQYAEVHYQIGDSEENEAGESDEDGWKVVGPIVADNSTVKIINKQVHNQFEFEKVVAGTMPEGVTDFTFTVEADDKDTKDAVKGQSFKAITKNATTDRVINSGQIIFDDNGKATQIKYGTDEFTEAVDISLEDNQKLVLPDLPQKATKFKVIETTTGHFDTNTHVDGEEKKTDSKEAVIELNREDAENSIQFENISPDLVPFTLKKTVSGNVAPADKDKEFTFDLTIKNPPANWGGKDQKEFKALKSDANDQHDLIFVKQADNSYLAEGITLKADQSITIYISEGLQIEAQETENHGFKVSHKFGSHEEDGDTHQITTNKDMPELIFNNHSQTTGIEVKKTVKSEEKDQLDESDFNKKFKFKVHGATEDGGALDGTFTLRKFEVNGQYSDREVSFNKNNILNFNLQHDQKAQLLGLPIGAKVQVTETNYDGYDPSYKVNENSEKQGDKATEFVTQEGHLGTVHFTNTKQVPEEASLMVKKVLAGPVTDEDKAFKFEFRVTATPKDGETDELNGKFDAEKLDHEGDTTDIEVEFTDGKSEELKLQGGESINIKGLSTDYKYSVSEASLPEEMMFETSYNVNNTTDKGGNETQPITLKDGQEGKVVFTNTKQVPEEASLMIKKVLAGPVTDEDKAFEFEFRVTATPKDGETDELNGKFDAEKLDHEGDTTDIEVEFTDGKSEELKLQG